MYTPTSNIDRKRALADSLRRTPSGGHWAQALAHALAQGMAGHQDYKASQAETQNEQTRTQEMGRLAEVLAGGGLHGPTQDGSTLMPQFTHPEVQEASLSNQMQLAQNEQFQSMRSGNPRYGNSPIWGKDAEGNWVMMQPSDQGGLQQAQPPEGVILYPSAGLAGFDPELIGQRGAAETAVEVDNIGQTAEPRAQAAAMETAATGDAQTEVELDRQSRMYAQERAQEREEARQSAFSRMSSQEDQINNVVSTADRILEQANGWTTGLMGSMLKWAPGTPQRDLAENLKTLEANAAFDKLQMMRDMSPTGGALGQVSERELDLLKSTWAALNQSQSPEQFRENVQRFRDQVKQSWANVVEAYEKDYGQSYYQTAPETGTQPTEPTELPGPGQNTGRRIRYDAQGNRIQ